MLTRVNYVLNSTYATVATPWKTRGSVTLMHVTIRIVHSFYPIAWVCQRLYLAINNLLGLWNLQYVWSITVISQFNHMVNTMVQYNGNEVNKCCEYKKFKVFNSTCTCSSVSMNASCGVECYLL